VSQEITLDLANAIVAAAFEHGREHLLKPLSAIVLDRGAHVICFQREDGSPNLRMKIALAKASGALALGISSSAIGALAESRPSLVHALSAISDHGIFPSGGGVIVIDQSGRTIGAVGVTGDTSENDDACARSGVAAVGLRTLE
jgi:uncharacterized protein GlcG (DUF336 family)